MKKRLNAALVRATGYQLQKKKKKAPVPVRKSRRRLRPGDRLLESPTFVLCSVRSGSTLLRVIPNSHSRICAPQELHLRDIAVQLKTDYAERSFTEVGLDSARLEYLLWDRVLHRELAESGKELIVNKTPNDVFIADRIRACWQDSRFIFLLRHPVSIARSRHVARAQDSDARNLEMVRRYCDAIEAARHTNEGLTVRYEDLTASPERESRRVCDYLGVPWEPEMLGRLKSGLGDWSAQIKSGRVQTAKPLPAATDVPEELRSVTVAWGYLSATSSSADA